MQIGLYCGPKVPPPIYIKYACVKRRKMPDINLIIEEFDAIYPKIIFFKGYMGLSEAMHAEIRLHC